MGNVGLGVEDLDCPLVEEGLPNTHEGLYPIPAFEKWGKSPNIPVADLASYIGTKSFPTMPAFIFNIAIWLITSYTENYANNTLCKQCPNGPESYTQKKLSQPSNLNLPLTIYSKFMIKELLKKKGK